MTTKEVGELFDMKLEEKEEEWALSREKTVKEISTEVKEAKRIMTEETDSLRAKVNQVDKVREDMKIITDANERLSVKVLEIDRFRDDMRSLREENDELKTRLNAEIEKNRVNDTNDLVSAELVTWREAHLKPAMQTVHREFSEDFGRLLEKNLKQFYLRPIRYREETELAIPGTSRERSREETATNLIDIPREQAITGTSRERSREETALNLIDITTGLAIAGTSRDKEGLDSLMEESVPEIDTEIEVESLVDSGKKPVKIHGRRSRPRYNWKRSPEARDFITTYIQGHGPDYPRTSKVKLDLFKQGVAQKLWANNDDWKTRVATRLNTVCKSKREAQHDMRESHPDH